MHAWTITGCAVAALLLGILSPEAQDRVLTGKAAFAGWRSDGPGVRRIITPADLPPPFATRSVGNGPGMRARPSVAFPRVPEGFSVEVFASDLAGPRTIREAPNGDVFVAESRAGRVSVLRPGADGAVKRSVYVDNLNGPYGIAFHPAGADPEWIYIAEIDRVTRFAYRKDDVKAGQGQETIVARLPTGGHWTRDIAFSPDGTRLYVAVGSRSNAAQGMRRLSASELKAHEAETARGAAWDEERDRAAVLIFTPDGERLGTLATGIRNCSGVAVEPTTGSLWCATNERDGLGDNLPPDYATSVGEGNFYGWPWFYIGGNQDPRHLGARPDLASQVTVPDVLLQAHSAPLGIAFYDHDAFPSQYRGDAFVTLHGSWNRSERTGYKVVRLPLDNGVATGGYEDFMTGFVISESQVWGRPVGITVTADGALLVSEDGNGTIWRVRADGS